MAKERYNAILERFIAEGRQAQREFALSSCSGNFINSEFYKVYYAIVAIAVRDNRSLKSKSGIEAVTGKFLDGCNWSGMSEFRKEVECQGNHTINYEVYIVWGTNLELWRIMSLRF